MSPYDAPRTYSLLVYSEQQEGIWYPLGGFHSVIAALVRHAERNGAKYRLSTPVARVLTSPDNPKLATGVLLESGEKLEADVVVVNADLIYSMNNLFGEPKAESLLDKVYGTYAARLAKKPVSCSSISFYWSIDRCVLPPRCAAADQYAESCRSSASTTSSSRTSTSNPLTPSSTCTRCPRSHLSTSTCPPVSTPRTSLSPPGLD